jgi:hypothetical protein
MIVRATVIAAIALAAGVSFGGAPADAQVFRHYPFCIFTGGPDGGFERCNYYSFEQCLYDRQAEGGVCYSNPNYTRAYEAAPRRRYR